MSSEEKRLRQLHEREFVEAFVLPNKRDRWNELLAGKRRSAILGRLAGWDDFLIGTMTRIPRATSSAQILAMIRNAHSILSEHCLVISMWVKIDQKFVPLEDAIEMTVGIGLGTVVSIDPGKLAYYEGEQGDRFLMRKALG